jgi:GTP-binding protein
VDLTPLLDMIIDKVPPPEADVTAPLCMQVATLDYDDYLGYVAIGRMLDGKISMGDRVRLAHKDGSNEDFRVAKLLAFQGLKRFEVSESQAGDIVAVTGMSELNVGETITSIAQPKVLPLMAIDEPTISMQFIANNGPFAGTEGKYVTTRNLRDRLISELKSNVALRVEDTDSPDTFKVSGRGELHLSVLIETMRREGYELCVSQPQVIFHEGPNGKTEPYEDLLVDVDEPYVGVVIEKLGRRAGRMHDMGPAGPGRTRIEFIIPSRGLIGYRNEFLTDTRGTGILNHSFREYGPYAGALKGRQNGVLIVQDPGETNTYALFSLQERGQLFLGTGEKVYAGQIVGMHARDNDLIVNPSKAKKLTNIRTTAADEKLFLTPPRVITLEGALEFINDDELVEVTPKAVRVRKRYLDHNLRKRHEKAGVATVEE